jgi:hypothetical protein
MNGENNLLMNVKNKYYKQSWFLGERRGVNEVCLGTRP